MGRRIVAWGLILIAFAQIAFVIAHFSANHLLDLAVSYSLHPAFFYSKAIVLPWATFILIQGFLYLFYFFVVEYFALLLGRGYAILWGGIGWIWIFAANTYYFPQSLFTQWIRSEVFNGALKDLWLKNLLWITSGLLLIGVVMAFIRLIQSVYAKQPLKIHGLALVVGSALVMSAFFPRLPAAAVATPSAYPTVLLIGFDALRPDCIGEHNICKTQTPYLNQSLRSTLYFTKAYTPLSRTSPAWTSILTGRYPKHHGARDNDVDIRLIQLTETLPKRLKAAGYETIYATDDRRYNNISEAFGFDRVIGPPMGLNDFLLGTFNDFPLSNLLVFSPWGPFLFPYNYANHAASVTYNPDHFLQEIDQALTRRSGKPLFLAVHFNVGSWPFHWYSDNQPAHENINPFLYRRAVEKADQQWGGFLKILQKHGLLSHTLMVLLSDHGITLGLRGDRLISSHTYQGQRKKMDALPVAQYATPVFSMLSKENVGLDTSYGYGGDVLSLKQSRVLLAFKGYGVTIAPRWVTQPVSLIDLAPTLLDYLSLPPFTQSDGISFYHQKTFDYQRNFYFETGIKDNAMEKETVSVGAALKNVMGYYQVDPQTGWIYMGQSPLNKLLLGKEQAILQGDWLLAHYPRSQLLKKIYDPKRPYRWQLKSVEVPAYFVLMNLKTQEWTLEWNTPLAKRAPLQPLYRQLVAFYGHEIQDPL